MLCSAALGWNTQLVDQLSNASAAPRSQGQASHRSVPMFVVA